MSQRARTSKKTPIRRQQASTRRPKSRPLGERAKESLPAELYVRETIQAREGTKLLTVINLDAMARGWTAAWADPDTRTVTDWGGEEVRMPGSAMKSDDDDHYSPMASPWNAEPLNHCHIDSPVRRIIYIKPIQCGGSAAGEVAICYWLVKTPGGDIAYYWESDQKAGDKWDQRFKKILDATPAVAALLPTDKSKNKNGAIILPHLNFNMLGVVSKGNTASTSIQREVLEEVHCWPAGKLAGATGRTTAYEDKSHTIFVISNASMDDDQLHRALKASTNQKWEVKCPGCGLYHAMRFDWEKKRPELGGLRGDVEKCRLRNGDIDWNKFEPTIRYQMPCGAIVPNDKKARASLSDGARYSAPTNPGAHLSNRGYTLEGVAVHHISWRLLFEEYFAALQALRYSGDMEPYKRFVQERKCVFFSPKDIPGTQRIELSSRRKEIAESPAEARRIMFVDFQHGKSRRGQSSHYWAVIRDYWLEGRRQVSRLIWAGKIHTEAEIEELREAHNVDPRFVGMDCGHEQTLILKMCARFGFAAFKGVGAETGERKSFVHYEEDARGNRMKVSRIYSEGELMNAFQGDPHGLQRTNAYVTVFKFCKQSLRDRFEWTLTAGEADFNIPEAIPGGVWNSPGEAIYPDRPDQSITDIYRAHLEAEGKIPKGHLMVWDDFGRDIDIKACELGCNLQAEIMGIVGAPPEAAKENADEIQEEEGDRLKVRAARAHGQHAVEE